MVALSVVALFARLREGYITDIELAVACRDCYLNTDGALTHLRRHKQFETLLLAKVQGARGGSNHIDNFDRGESKYMLIIHQSRSILGSYVS